MKHSCKRMRVRRLFSTKISYNPYTKRSFGRDIGERRAGLADNGQPEPDSLSRLRHVENSISSYAYLGWKKYAENGMLLDVVVT